MGPTLYETLGVSPDASHADIEAAYQRHVTQGNVTSSIQHAYAVLSDPDRRDDYHRWISGGGSWQPSSETATPALSLDLDTLPPPPPAATHTDTTAEEPFAYEHEDETWAREDRRARGYPMPQWSSITAPFKRRNKAVRTLDDTRTQIDVVAKDLQAAAAAAVPRLRELAHLKKLWTIAAFIAAFATLPKLALTAGVPAWQVMVTLMLVGAGLGHLRRRALGVSGTVINVAYPLLGILTAICAGVAIPIVGSPIADFLTSGPVAWAAIVAAFATYRYLSSSRHHNSRFWARVLTGPKPGEIWWAWVGYATGVDEHGNTGKERPVFVMWVTREKFGKRWYTVAPITSQEKRRGQRGYLEISRRRWNRAGIFRPGVSFLNYGDLRKLQRASFTKRLGKPSAPDRQRIYAALPHPDHIDWVDL